VLSRIGLILARLSKSSADFPRRLVNSRYLANDSRSSEDVGPNEVAPMEFVLLAALPLVLDSPPVTSPAAAGLWRSRSPNGSRGKRTVWPWTRRCRCQRGQGAAKWG
jgi:hypothetical protein